MSEAKRITIDLEPDVHRALRLKAMELDCSISEITNTAIRHALAQDAADLDAFQKRCNELSIDFENFAINLCRRGRL